MDPEEDISRLHSRECAMISKVSVLVEMGLKFVQKFLFLLSKCSKLKCSPKLCLITIRTLPEKKKRGEKIIYNFTLLRMNVDLGCTTNVCCSFFSFCDTRKVNFEKFLLYLNLTVPDHKHGLQNSHWPVDYVVKIK